MPKFYVIKGVFLFLLSTLISCQNDDYVEPKTTPKEYTFSIPNKLNFKFSQTAESNSSLTPYKNSLIVENIGDNSISSNFVTLAFKSDTLNYNNLSFLKNSELSDLEINSESEKIEFVETSNLFSDNNTIVSVINLETAHEFSGLYSGEINIFNTIDNSFIKSFNCTAVVDFQGSFHLFTQDNSEQKIVHLKGDFNNENQVSGSIFNISGDLFSVLQNSLNTPLILDNGSLTGSLLFTDSETSTDNELKFDLAKQN